MGADGKASFASLLLHGGLVLLGAGWAYHPAGVVSPAGLASNEAGWSLFYDSPGEIEAAECSDESPAEPSLTAPPSYRVPAIPVAGTIVTPAVEIVATSPQGALPAIAAGPASAAPARTVRAAVAAKRSGSGKAGARSASGKAGGGGSGGAAGGGGGGFVPVRYASTPRPAYPAAAKRAHITGLVVIFVLVDEAGNPATVRLSRSSGHAILDEAPLSAVRHWKFEPARLDGRAIPAKIEAPVCFAAS